MVYRIRLQLSNGKLAKYVRVDNRTGELTFSDWRNKANEFYDPLSAEILIDSITPKYPLTKGKLVVIQQPF